MVRTVVPSHLRRQHRHMMHKNTTTVRGFNKMNRYMNLWKKHKHRLKQMHEKEVSPHYSSSSETESESTSDSESESDREDESDYKQGGYYRVRLNQIIHNRYRIVRKLGYGYFSTVWLVQSLHSHRLFAMKIQKSDSHFAKAAVEEHKFYQHLQAPETKTTTTPLLSLSLVRPFVIRLEDFFALRVTRPVRAKHYCLVFESMWKDLYGLMKKRQFKSFPMTWIRTMSYQALLGVYYLHRENIIHTDLKPENFLVTPPGQTPFMLKVADLGNACFVDKQYSDDIQTRQYRSPEVILGYPYSTPVDIFSLGVMFMEFMVGDCIFNPPRCKQKNSAVIRNEKQLALMISALQTPIPRFMIKQSKYGRHFFDPTCTLLRHARHVPEYSLKNIIEQTYGRVDPQYLDLIQKMLCLNPHQRITAHQALQHPFFESLHRDFQTQGNQVFRCPVEHQ